MTLATYYEVDELHKSYHRMIFKDVLKYQTNYQTLLLKI